MTKISPKLMAAIERLRRQYPRENREKLKARLMKLMENDSDLLHEVAESCVRDLQDEQYDKAAREGRFIPEHLKRPS